jgi:4-amino-4-deoxy-L-arabinose transferase-like glycosyltransferase
MEPPESQKTRQAPAYLGPAGKRQNMTGKRQEIIFLFIITVISAFLLFSNLGNRYMWQDEAQTSLIAKTVMDRGLPYGTDGRNFFSQDDGAEYGKDYLWKWHPWLQFYVLAPFIKTFGFSNLIARFPFALFALASILLVYFFVKELFNSPRKAMLAAAVLSLYVPFLILGRQSRYYAPEMFFCLLAMHAYARVLNSRKYAGLLYAIALTMLFHTIYIYLFAVIAACAAHALIYRKGKTLQVLIPSAAAFLLNIPFLFTIYGINFLGVHPNIFNPVHFLESLRSYAGFAATELPGWWALLLIPAYILLKKKFRTSLGTEGGEYLPGLMLPVLFILAAFLCMAVLAHWPFYRNIAGTVPFFAVLSALLMAPAFHARFYAGVLVVAIFAITGGMPGYIYEITHDYDGPVEGMVKYLNEHGKSSDTVLITYGDMPLKLYTKMKVYGGLSGEHYENVKKPEWIIIRKHVLDDREKKTAQFIADNIDRKGYEKIRINYPDDIDENSERPSKHAFKTDDTGERVIIYRRSN